MSVFQQDGTRVQIGDVRLSTAEWVLIRPAQALPGLPVGASTLRYEAASGVVRAWDGVMQVSADGFDANAADALLADETAIASELAAYHNPLTVNGAVERLRREREARQAVMSWHDGSADRQIDANDSSLPRITGAVTAARLAQEALDASWSIIWTTADNQDVTLTAAQMIDLGLAVMGYVTAVHYRWRELRVEIEAAADPAAAWAVDITGGWPG